MSQVSQHQQMPVSYGVQLPHPLIMSSVKDDPERVLKYYNASNKLNLIR